MTSTKFFFVAFLALVANPVLAAQSYIPLPPYRAPAERANLNLTEIQREAVSSQPAGPTKSQMFLLPGDERAMADLQMGFSENSGRDYDFRYTYGLSKSWHLSAQVGYGESSEGINAKGMKDIFVGVAWAEEYENLTPVVGIDVGVSPGARVINPNEGTGNKFSGGYTFAPYLGFEKITKRSGVWGARLSANQTYMREIRTTGWGSSIAEQKNPLVNLDGFFEMPVTRESIFGITAGVGRSEYAFDPVDMYSIGAYGTYEVMDETLIEAKAMANSTTYDSAKTQSTVQIGLKKIL